MQEGACALAGTAVEVHMLRPGCPMPGRHDAGMLPCLCGKKHPPGLHACAVTVVSCCRVRMQRLRETIRGWAADPTIRDVTLLLEARRAIEHEMVRACASCSACLPDPQMTK